MLCGTIKTRCQICEEFFQEEACADESGTVWKEHGGQPLEDGATWCHSCIGYLNQFCEDLGVTLTWESKNPEHLSAQGFPTHPQRDKARRMPDTNSPVYPKFLCAGGENDG